MTKKDITNVSIALASIAFLFVLSGCSHNPSTTCENEKQACQGNLTSINSSYNQCGRDLNTSRENASYWHTQWQTLNDTCVKNITTLTIERDAANRSLGTCMTAQGEAEKKNGVAGVTLLSLIAAIVTGIVATLMVPADDNTIKYVVCVFLAVALLFAFCVGLNTLGMFSWY